MITEDSQFFIVIREDYSSEALREKAGNSLSF